MRDARKRTKVSNTAAKVISDAIFDTLEQCISPEQRVVLINLNSNIIKQWDKGNISMDSANLMVDCFEREKVGN